MYRQDDDNATLAPSHQLHYGPSHDPSVVSRYSAVTGQLNPIERDRLAMQHGRFLGGFGGNMENVQEKSPQQEIYDLEQEDDVLGSGIFDPHRRPGTANADAGVLASHNSLPGYIARDRPFTVSPEVADITANAAVVTVPGGGMAYVEREGRNVGPSFSRGPAARSPRLRPAPLTGRMEPYAFLTEQRPDEQLDDGWSVDALLWQADAQAPDAYAEMFAPAAPVLPPEYGPPAPSWMPSPAHVETFPRPILPTKPPALAGTAWQGRGRPVSIATTAPYRVPPTTRGVGGDDYPYPPAQLAYQPPWNVRTVPMSPRYGVVPSYPAYRRVPSFAGDPPSPAGWGTYLAAGLIIGIAARVFWGATKGGGRG